MQPRPAFGYQIIIFLECISYVGLHTFFFLAAVQARGRVEAADAILATQVAQEELALLDQVELAVQEGEKLLDEVCALVEDDSEYVAELNLEDPELEAAIQSAGVATAMEAGITASDAELVRGFNAGIQGHQGAMTRLRLRILSLMQDVATRYDIKH
jgi:hypothetical protein